MTLGSTFADVVVGIRAGDIDAFAGLYGAFQPGLGRYLRYRDQARAAALKAKMLQAGLPVPAYPTLIITGALAARGGAPLWELVVTAVVAALIAAVLSTTAWISAGEASFPEDAIVMLPMPK